MIYQMMSFLTEIPDGEVFRLDLQLIISICAHFVNIAFLVFVMSKLLYKPVRSFMQNRTNRIAGQLERADEELKNANQMKSEYEQKVKAVEEEREAILASARKEATESSRITLSEAKQEADELLARAKANIELEWERNRAQMRLEIINVSADMTEKYLKRAIDKKDLDRLFAETMEELGEMAWRN